MRLADFLIYLLEAHAETLRRLAALLGEGPLLEVLEAAGEIPSDDPASLLIDKDPTFFSKPLSGSSSSAYAELESAVRGFDLAPVLEFHLWAYPLYRCYIESSAELQAWIPPSGETTAPHLADEAMQSAKKWVQKLPLPPELGKQVERAADVPWIRFRASVLKKIGQRPLGPVT